ncbi:MAG: restriction endonuclease [Oscillospiraceae bacterium]|nr:restriction endonuclease [Oscillospiraceae bacterium]
MELLMDTTPAEKYRSNSQKARVITEQWVADNMFCPRCGSPRISHFENNKPVADFFCPVCDNQFELKSKNGASLEKVTDGAYSTMINRITSLDNPDFFFMSYSKADWSVRNFFFVPKHFFTPGIIEKRRPLSENARRAGWVGCNILLESIPATGRIPIIEHGQAIDEKEVLKKVAIAESLVVADINARGWLLDVLSCVDRIESRAFTLSEVYGFENELSAKHPANHNVRPKIRQQLQLLRDRGLIEFTRRGEYRKNG